VTSVFIVAPVPALRAGLRAMLAEAEVEVVGEASALSSLVPDLDQVDVVLVGDEELLADAPRIVDDNEPVAFVVLSEDGAAIPLLRSLSLRGWGIIPVDATAAELAVAMHAVAQGLIVLSPSFVSRLTETFLEPGEIPEPLTNREREVLDLVGQGLPNKLIARELLISEHTVKFHISSILTKLGATSRTDAVSKGARQGLITL
jgi:DNA-binding NarL/FixJ family response regulator